MSPSREHPSPGPGDYRQVVLTGGPGAGKTAILELVRRHFCPHVLVLPEAASIVFGGGFPRTPDDAGREAAQQAIFHVQRQLEHFARSRDNVGLAMCDRGTLDGLAYWPGAEADFWRATGSTAKNELARYHAVIHVRTPSQSNGYNHSNKIRIETAAQAAIIDSRIAEVWKAHPCRFEVPATTDFVTKAERAIKIITGLLPAGCGVERHSSASESEIS